MTILQSIFLGILEGITEFLPVSSTAHLLVAQKIFGYALIDETFTIVIQMGAIAALMWRLRTELIQEIQKSIASMQYPKKLFSTKLAVISIASIPTLIVGFLVKDFLESLHENFFLIAVMSIGIGFLLAASEWYAKKQQDNTISTKDVFRMGLWQLLALIPGTSRSGITTASALFAGVDRTAALEWSFYLSMPTLLAATLYEVVKTLLTQSPVALLSPSLLIGTVSAFVSAYFCIPFLRRIVATHGFLPFVLYRILFGIAILTLLR